MNTVKQHKNRFLLRHILKNADDIFHHSRLFIRNLVEQDIFPPLAHACLYKRCKNPIVQRIDLALFEKINNTCLPALLVQLLCPVQKRLKSRLDSVQ